MWECNSMASTRRSPESADSKHHVLPINDEIRHALFISERRQIILLLLACLLLLGCLALRFHAGYLPAIRKGNKHEGDGNLIRFSVIYSQDDFQKDKRGWLLNPVVAATHAGLTGGAEECKAVHVGEIKPGGVRGNHRHRACNETFIIWGARTRFRLEDPAMEKGYAELLVGAKEVAVVTSPKGRAHALANVDWSRATYFFGCQDAVLDSNNRETDFTIWKDL